MKLNYDGNINVFEVNKFSYKHEEKDEYLKSDQIGTTEIYDNAIPNRYKKYLKDMKSKVINRSTKFQILSNKSLSKYTPTNFNKYYEQGRHVINRTSQDVNKDLKLILLYSPLFPSFKDGYGLWKRFFHLESPYTCKNGFSCRLTTDHHQLKEASGVMVSLHGLPKDPDTYIPAGYIPPDNQKWIAHWAEAPWYFVDEAHQHHNIKYWLQMLDNIFDWTSSYHKDSTFTGIYNKNCSYVKNKIKQPVEKGLILKSKTSSALWVVSHCGATSGRDQYVQESQITGYKTSNFYQI